MNAVEWLLEGSFTVAGAPVVVREVVGNGFGLASAWFGLRRRVWAWPVGIVGNLLLLTVFVGGVLARPQEHDLWGQAARQVFFIALSAYGWSRWRQRRGRELDGRDVTPRWAGTRGRLELAAGAIVGMAVFPPILARLDSYGPVPDAWILTGSMLATYAMARGYVEFWLIWIAVDAVGVPLLVRAEYYPSAIMYAAYGGLCVVGFVAWLRAARRAEVGPVHERTPA